jgi:S1-C subfamily serine protease
MARVAALACAGVALLMAACGADASSDTPFERVRASVVFIETDLGTGSGVVFDEQGHIVTNYHVIQDASELEVLLAGGARFDDPTIVGFDRRADIAVLKLPDRSGDIAPIEFADSEDLSIGDDVFAIGYPFEGGEDEAILQMSAGIVSATRPGLLGEVEYIQTDASFNAGLSGGALVDRDGRFVGMPTWVFIGGDTTGLAISEDDVARVARQLISRRPRSLPVSDAGDRQVSDSIDDLYDSAGYQVTLEEGDVFEATIDAAGDVALSLVDPYGAEVAYADDLDTAGQEVVTWDADVAGPYTLTVIPFEYAVSFTLEASHALRAFDDPEDGRTVQVGDEFVGELQFAGDEDTFLLELTAGDEVTMTLRSWDFDAYLIVLPPFADQQENDDSGLGLSGTDARLRLTADEGGTYEIAASYFFTDELLPGRGFYRLSIDEGQ